MRLGRNIVAIMALPVSGLWMAPAAFADAAGPPAPSPIMPVALTPCDKPGSNTDAWIDRMQRGVYSTVCGTAAWFDGLFGNPRFEQDSDETFGRLGLFESYDRRDKADTRLRLRARVALPNLENRFRVVVGRGQAQELVEERPASSENPLPPTFNSVNDEAWLLGLGYSKQNGLERGFDFGIGVRLRTPIDPYVKATYRHNFVFNSDTMLRFRETPFWRDSRGFGTTTEVTLDHLVNQTLLARWNNTATIAEDTEGFEWSSNVSLYQSISRRRAVSYTVLMVGETEADVKLQNYGFEARYRQNVYREWLFMELRAGLTWPKETLEEERKINPGVGIGFEMYFGPVPDNDMR
ncbi:MAG: hypothetical protein R3F24_12835 [Gammaproteobacteria bacterium]